MITVGFATRGVHNLILYGPTHMHVGLMLTADTSKPTELGDLAYIRHWSADNPVWRGVVRHIMDNWLITIEVLEEIAS